MLVGIPKEIKNQEHRVGATPEMVHELVAGGHKAVVESGAGHGIGATDSDYRKAGAKIAKAAQDIFAASDMVIKVKEPQKSECKMLRPGQVLFTYLHLAPDPEQTRALVASGAVCIAYETITSGRGNELPLLTPMSQIAGRLSIQAAAACLQHDHGGPGLLMGGVTGVSPAKICIIGGGVVGRNAMRVAVGCGADVTVLDRSIPVLEQIATEMGPKVKTLYSNAANLSGSIADADVVVGGVLIPGAAAPKLVTRKMVRTMKPKSVVVDVCIDQGGCFETSRVTTHSDPTYVEHGVIHYCVGNMPGVVPRSSTYALTNATSQFAARLAKLGWRKALAEDAHFRDGLNVAEGKITHRQVAQDQRLKFVDPMEVIGG